jgi:SPX domain protein involved in polyphosphate accumulation
VDWTQAWYAPEETLKETDLHRFPYAVLEVRLPQEESERPVWLRELLAWDKLRVVPNFSKFGHACAVLYRKVSLDVLAL